MFNLEFISNTDSGKFYKIDKSKNKISGDNNDYHYHYNCIDGDDDNWILLGSDGLNTNGIMIKYTMSNSSVSGTLISQWKMMG